MLAFAITVSSFQAFGRWAAGVLLLWDPCTGMSTDSLPLLFLGNHKIQLLSVTQLAQAMKLPESLSEKKHSNVTIDSSFCRSKPDSIHWYSLEMKHSVLEQSVLKFSSVSCSTSNSESSAPERKDTELLSNFSCLLLPLHTQNNLRKVCVCANELA